MLHATARRGKSTLYKRYLGHREKGELHVHGEDEITSTVIGPLDFLLPSEVHYFWNNVLKEETNHFIADIPSTAVLKLWDSRNANITGLRIEPDARIEFEWSNGMRRILLIEFKWRAPLSGENQLHRQWREYLTEDERENALHLFIAPEISSGMSAQQSKDVWGDRLVLITWMQIRRILQVVSNENNTGLGRWAIVADKFLERIGISSFSGFNYLGEYAPHSLDISKPIIWKPYSGFSMLRHFSKLPAAIPATLFYKIQK